MGATSLVNVTCCGASAAAAAIVNPTIAIKRLRVVFMS
jgi:hypothetical protein